MTMGMVGTIPPLMNAASGYMNPKKDHQKKDANIAAVGLLSLATDKESNGNNESNGKENASTEKGDHHPNDTVPEELQSLLQLRHTHGPHDPQYHHSLQLSSKQVASFAATGHPIGMMML